MVASCGHRILVVDDEADIVDLFAMLLALHGHHCRGARTGSQAIELIASFDPTVILLDIALPDVDGYQIARHVRTTRGREIFIAAVTGWGQLEDRESAYAAGFDLHVTKPVGEATLLDIVSRATRRSSC